MAGRKRKYETEEEQLEAKRKHRMDYYWRHREKILEDAKKKYQEKKDEMKKDMPDMF